MADVLILPLKDFGRPYLGLSTKLYEYQAAKKPIICCSYGMPGDYINNTHSGIVVKPGDSNELVKSILYLKKNKDIANQLAENGRKYVLEYLTLRQIGFNLKMQLIKIILNR